MILNLINEKNIVAKADADSWEEAIEIAGKVLLDNGCVEEKYIDKMISIVKELGPYIVIDKGLALAHARPEDGAKKLGLSFVTLKTPVCFGNEDNDPVQIVIGLSATDGENHLELLGGLTKLLTDEDTMSKILASNDNKEIKNLIYKVYE